jgi:hypothetical protein
VDGAGALVDALDRVEWHEDAPPRGKEAARRDQHAGHDPAFVLEAEIGGAPHLAVWRDHAIAEDVVAVAGEVIERRKPAEIRAPFTPPVGLPALY